jgi:hypothetical protein
MKYVKFPSRIDFGFRPYRGLSFREIVYLTTGATISGLLVFTEMVPGPFVLRAIVGLVVLAAALTLAFVPYKGRKLDAWLAPLIRYYTGTRQRVWRKEGDTLEIGPQMVPPPATAVVMPAARGRAEVRAAEMALPLSVAGVLLGFWIVIVTSTIMIWLLSGGSLVWPR